MAVRGIRTVLFAALLAGCSSAPASELDESAQPDLSGEPSVLAACEPLPLTTPAGNRLDLTGTWQGATLTHYVRQVGSCVWWVGQADESDATPTQGIILFRGMLDPSTIDGHFTLTGEWMMVVRAATQVVSDAGHGPVTFRVEIEPGSNGETMTLVSTTPEGMQGGMGPYAGMSLIYEGPLPPSP